MVTSDGGLHWSQYEVKERPLSLFFLNESLGWMVTDRGLWSTLEGGRAWSKVQSRKGILQAWFLDANHGYITGMKGLVQETTDGGKTWSKLEASDQAPDAAVAQLRHCLVPWNTRRDHRRHRCIGACSIGSNAGVAGKRKNNRAGNPGRRQEVDLRHDPHRR